MYMTPFVKRLLTLIFNIAVIVVLTMIVIFIIGWAASLFLVPGQLVNLIDFLVFIYAAYRVVMLIIAFLESNPVQ